MAIKSGEPIEVRKDALEGAMGRGGAEFTEAVEIEVWDGGDGGGQLTKLKKKVVVVFDGSRSSHRGAQAEFEEEMKKMKESDASDAPDARVVEKALRGVKGPKLVRFHLAVEGARQAVWVAAGSQLEIALRGMVVEAMKAERAREAPGGGPWKEETEGKKETAAENAARLIVAEEVAEAAAEEEEAAQREAEWKETEQALDLAMEEERRAAARVEGLRVKLAQQIDVERLKRKRKQTGEARKEEIVMVYDREFKDAVRVYDGPVHHVWVERFERPGPRGIGPVRGGDFVVESVYCSAEEAEGLLALLATLATRTGDDGYGDVVVKGFKDVVAFDAWMEEHNFVPRVIDVESRCMNPGGPAEPEWCDDTERVWLKRGSVELAALDKLIANERARKWQCPPSPPYVYAPDDDDEMSCVD